MNWCEKRCDEDFEEVGEVLTYEKELGTNVNIEKEVRLLFKVSLKTLLKRERILRIDGRPRR